MGGNDENDDDSKAWEEETKGVRRIPKDASVPRPPKKITRRPSGPSSLSEIPLPQKRAAPGSNSVDKRTAEKLKRGEMPIEGRLDLHGRTQEEALTSLLRFIRSAYGAGKRCVLVITGKGKGDGGGPGVLQSRMPEWLADERIAPMVLRCQKAQQKDGGAGALYVLLRRKRD